MKHIDLYSGIGGFALACRWLGIETILFCENDKFCQQVLNKHWPDVPIVEDVNDKEEIKRIVTDAYGKRLSGKPSIQRKAGRIKTSDGLLLTAGFPCQPFSGAGKRKGSDDDRYLWPQTLAVIESVKPDWVILENVAGLLSMVFPGDGINVANQTTLFDNPDEEIADYNTITGRIDSDLRQAGYETVWLVIPACAVGAPHRRDRVWIVANAKNSKCKLSGRTRARRQGFTDNYRTVTNSSLQGLQGQQPRECQRFTGQPDREWSNEKPDWHKNWYEVAAEFCRVDARVSNRVDRLKALGNSIVPQVAFEIIRSIYKTHHD
jgi:DNA (cytosine-5)-methyltransferase 1